MSLVIDRVTKTYGKQKALDEVSFEVKQGEIIGFLGPNGAGKSTLMKIITGYLTKDSGTIKICGLDIDAHALQTRKKIGYLPEHNPLYLDMYIKEYLYFTAQLYKVKGIKKRVDELIQLVALQREQHKKIGSLSKGYRQRVGLAQALLPDPDVLILDEPTTGLDPNQILEVRRLIKTVAQNKTVMLSTHIMQEVDAICQRVVIIDQGKIVADCPQHELKNLFQENKTIQVEFSAPIDYIALQALSGVMKLTTVQDNKYVITHALNEDLRASIYDFSINQGVKILELNEQIRTTENLFRQLTQASAHE